MKKSFLPLGIMMIIVGSLIIINKRIPIGWGVGIEIKYGMEYFIAIPEILFGMYLSYQGIFKTNFITKFKNIISDFKIIHLILFIFITFPLWYIGYLIVFEG